MELKKHFVQYSTVKLFVKKYLGSHRVFRPAGAEYKSFDDLLRNVAGHSGFS